MKLLLINTPEEHYRSPIVRFGIFFIGVIVLITAPFAAHAAVLQFMQAQQSLHWATTQATIIESAVKEPFGLMTNRTYRPSIRYEYTVDQKRYTGNTISCHDSSYGDRAPAQGIVSAYELGSMHTLYYNPEEPSMAVLEPGCSWRAYLFLALPIACAAFGVIFLALAKALAPEARRQRNVA